MYNGLQTVFADPNNPDAAQQLMQPVATVPQPIVQPMAQPQNLTPNDAIAPVVQPVHSPGAHQYLQGLAQAMKDQTKLASDAANSIPGWKASNAMVANLK